MHKPAPNGPFYLPKQPDANDKRPRNAFGILLDFGKAAAAYYRKKDREAARRKREK